VLTPSILLSLKVAATLKAHPPTSNDGVRSAPVPLADLMVAPIDPLDPQLAERLHFEAPLQMKQTFAYTDVVIKHGMELEVGSKGYAIKGVSPWPDEGNYVFYQLILEDIKVI
jgi:hypothetical protein